MASSAPDVFVVVGVVDAASSSLPASSTIEAGRGRGSRVENRDQPFPWVSMPNPLVAVLSRSSVTLIWSYS
jgi:hypothetical protein